MNFDRERPHASSRAADRARVRISIIFIHIIRFYVEIRLRLLIFMYRSCLAGRKRKLSELFACTVSFNTELDQKSRQQYAQFLDANDLEKYAKSMYWFKRHTLSQKVPLGLRSSLTGDLAEIAISH